MRDAFAAAQTSPLSSTLPLFLLTPMAEALLAANASTVQCLEGWTWMGSIAVGCPAELPMCTSVSLSRLGASFPSAARQQQGWQ